jgi:hypothetical protein
MRRLAMAFVLPVVLVACPPKPSEPAFARCGANAVRSCEVIYILAPSGETFAVGEGWTSGSATFISIELTLEQRQADGSWTGIWIDRSGLGRATKHRTYTSATIDCERGQYRWHMRVRFNGVKTVYWKTTPAFWAL